jgi:fatty acid desaturase
LLYWIVPYCTWHIAIQYPRIICEHSAVESDEAEYAITRTTIPTWLESIFILPCNVGYHIEHHWYPSVPFYRLPDLHQQLMAREGFQRHAVVRRSVFASLVSASNRRLLSKWVCSWHEADLQPIDHYPPEFHWSRH